MIKKYLFVGDLNSINIEIINKSHNRLKNKVKYILLGNRLEISNYLKRISSRLKINEIYDPISFKENKKNYLNVFNIENVSSKKHINLLNQIKISNKLANKTKVDLVTLPINKSLFKKKIEFIGMTEYLAKINNSSTLMLMHGEKFSVIPLTTHINLKYVKDFINKKYLNLRLNEILNQTKRKIYNLNISKIKFLCYNPHCSENNTIGSEDKIITHSISNFKKITGPYSADSAFKNIEKNNTLYISMYHDQVLIPFKILNEKGINLTMGLDYRRLSPTHGTASDIKFKNIASVSSYLACMEY